MHREETGVASKTELRALLQPTVALHGVEKER